MILSPQPFRATQWFNDHWDTLVDADYDAHPVGMKLFTRAPYMAAESLVYPDYTALADLTEARGWVPAATEPVSQFEGSPDDLVGRIVSDAFQVGKVVGGVFTSGFVDPAPAGPGINSGWLCTPSGNSNDNRKQELVSMVVFYLTGTVDSVVDPILFFYWVDVGDDVVLHDDMLIGTTGNGHFLAVRIGGIFPLTQGNLYIQNLVPPWESAGAIHVWVKPQRVNFIANPNFQNGDLEQAAPYWTSSAVDGTSEIYQERDTAGVLTGLALMESGGTQLNIESNFFPTTNRLWACISFMVNADVPGVLRTGLLCWNSTYDVSTYVCTGPSINPLHADLALVGNAPASGLYIDGVYTAVRLLTRIAPGTSEAQLRLEWTPDAVSDTNLYLKNVLVDLEEGQYNYFDGDEVYGKPGDFRWHGGESHAHFSMWYNNFNNTEARLFGGFDPGVGTYQPGLAEEWVPTGVDVYGHWHAIAAHQPKGWSGDYYYPIVDVHAMGATLVPDERLTPTLRPNV